MTDTTTPKLEVVSTKEDLGTLLRAEWVRSGRPDLRGLARQVKSSKTTISEVQAGKRLIKRDLLVSLLESYRVPAEERPRWLQAWARVASNERSNEIDTDTMPGFVEFQKRAEEAEQKLADIQESRKLGARARKSLIHSGEFIGRWIARNKSTSEIQETFSQLMLTEEIEHRLNLVPLPENASMLADAEIIDSLRRGFWKGFLPQARSRLHDEGVAVPDALAEDFLRAVAQMSGEDEEVYLHHARKAPLEPWAELTIYAPLEGHEEAFNQVVFDVLRYAKSDPDILMITYQLIPYTPNHRLLYILWHDEGIGLKSHGHCYAFDGLDGAFKSHLANEWVLDPSLNPAALDTEGPEIPMPSGAWWLRHAERNPRRTD